MENFIYSIGEVNTTHEKEHISPYRSNDKNWRFMCFSTPFLIKTDNGIEKGNTGDCLINEPFTHFWHTSAEDAETGFVNSWIHCEASDMSKKVKQYGLPVNQLIHTAGFSFFSDDLNKILNEEKEKKLHWQARMAALFECMLIDIARQSEQYQQNRDSFTAKRIDEFNRLKTHMLENYLDNYTVSELADKIHLSPERFAVAYKQVFNSSPINDLNKKRLAKAQELLITTSASIGEISVQSGFGDLSYFSRMFKKYVGVSPKNYRGKS